MRRDGKFWNAYYALPGTMNGALLLGSVALQFVQTQDRRNAFMALMREGVADIIEQRTGVRPLWPNAPQPAPESERVNTNARPRKSAAQTGEDGSE